ncbi:MAG: Ig-like domain-containing protein [Deltaproteobacteria bacterium]|nr:Ig-like domain-containing protein [Deltaproteobacteria bacterium]
MATLVPFVATCGGGRSGPSAPAGGGGTLTELALVQAKDLPKGLDLRLSNGAAGPPPFDRAKLAPATKLGDPDAEAILRRARPIASDPDDGKAFALRPGSQPAPRTGTTIKGQFPPAPSTLLPPPKSTDASADLRVLRWMPEGNVPLAPQLSVTFSQPMVAVTSQADAAAVVPVQLTPAPRGAWRWIGTRTIVFDPDVRFPQATTYKVEVPAGTRSANGGVLKDAVRFTFETPAPKVVQSFPSGGPQHLDVPMFAMFDQKIDPAAVLASIKVTANGAPQAVRLLDAVEIAKHRPLQAIVDGANKAEQAGRWLAFRTTSRLPTDASVNVEVAAGTPSVEGPNKTKAAQSFSFRTYPPFRVLQGTCGYDKTCPPAAAFTIQLNNPLDVEKFDDKLVTVTPEVPGLKVMGSGEYITLVGMTKARTSYKVVLSGGTLDEFGQALGKDVDLSWNVTDAVPTFYGPSGLVVLDPAAKKPTLDFFSTNYDQLKVRLYKVDLSDFDAYASFIQNQWNHDKPPPAPGTKVFDGLVKTTGGANQLVETRLDLAAALGKDGLGHVVAVVEPSPWKETWQAPRMISWVQSTRLGIDAYVDPTHLVAFATDLGTGAPLANASVEIWPHKITGTTDDKGVAKLALGAGGVKGQHRLIARRGTDSAFVAENGGWYGGDHGSWVKQSRATALAWYVIDDRKMYRPGEEVALKGLLRTIDHGIGGDVGGVAGAVTKVGYEVRDARGNKIAQGAAAVSAVGGFDAKFTLPKTPNLGYATVSFKAEGRMSGTYQHGLRVEEFRRPEFEVSTQAGAGPFLVGASGDVTVSAKYFAGGPLPGAAVNWYVQTSPASFTPPNRDDFTFGTWVPWWGGGGRHYDDDDGDYDGGGGGNARSYSFAAKTDATGAHVLHLDFLSANPATPMSVTANANVTDVNRQTWSSAAALIVHPSSLYAGLRAKRPFVEKGTPFELDVIGVDLDGKAAAGTPIEVRATRLDWKFAKGRYVQEEVEPQLCKITAAQDPQPCKLTTDKGGTYKVTASLVDAKGRPNVTTMNFWVSGGDAPPARDVAQEQVQLIPDKKAYAPGTTAELLMQAPFYPAEAIVSWRRSGMVKSERIKITGPTKVITVPIADAMTPNMTVQVDLVGAAARTDDKGQADPKLPKRPAYAVGSIDLPVPPKQRTLGVTVTPNAAKLAPGDTTKVGVTVVDAAGRPVPNAETTVLVVDEAILSLTGYKHPSPIDAFYGHRGADVRDFYSRAYVKLSRPSLDAMAAASGDRDHDGIPDMADAEENAPAAGSMKLAEGRMGKSTRGRGAKNKEQLESMNGADDDDGDPGAPDKAIAIRANFNPLAAFAPSVTTDASGRATVDIKLPDNLTRYRIVAIAAVGDKQFGKGENALVARLPLMVRPSPPRFLNFGDTFQLPVVVQNQTDAPMKVRLAARATNARLTDGSGREVTVPANDRVEVLFPAAAELAGTARFQILGASGAYTDASELALPVWTPATTEAFATYGTIDGTGADAVVKQPVALPGKVVTQFGGVEVTTASTNLQALTDAMLYLVAYPYECAEQRSSRIMAVAALRDVLTAFKTKDLPSPAAMEARVRADIERLSQMQNDDGGYAFWDRGYPSDPYLTVYVTNALQHAKAKGFTVPQHLLDRARPYLKDIERKYPHYYGPQIRWAISAYALLTRKELGDLDVAKGQRLFAEATLDKMTMETAGWLLATFAGQAAAATERKALVRHAMNKVSETAGAANFTTSYGDGNYLLLGSDRRVDSVMLDALIQEDEKLDLIPKVVTGLLAHRKAGRWLNTQENTFALRAMDRYFDTFEKATPDFLAKVWLGNDFAGEKAFKGRSTDYFAISIPMKDVASHDKQALAIQKDGAGRLYYRIGMTYAPASLKLDPADHGFVVQRAYEGVDDPKDVARAADGTWKVKAGARVRVKVTMVNENRRYHVALVDPMPAGFEAMNPALATTGPIPLDPKEQAARGAYWWWLGPWYEHQNLRDERVEAFAAMLWEGVHAYSYVARATTPGTFVVPPAKAEEMYMPETFGRSGSDRVIVE